MKHPDGYQITDSDAIEEKKNECSGDPNPETIAAMNEDITNRPRFNNVASLMEYLNSDSK